MAPVRPSPSWPRLWLVHGLQLPALVLLLWGEGAAAAVAAAAWGSVVCCAGTDSTWRWRNRLLVAEAALWLALGLAVLPLSR